MDTHARWGYNAVLIPPLPFPRGGGYFWGHQPQRRALTPPPPRGSRGVGDIGRPPPPSLGGRRAGGEAVTSAAQMELD